MNFWRLWVILASADWTVRVLAGVLLGGGLSLTAETWLSLLIVPPLEAAAMIGAVGVLRSVRRHREARP